MYSWNTTMYWMNTRTMHSWITTYSTWIHIMRSWITKYLMDIFMNYNVCNECLQCIHALQWTCKWFIHFVYNVQCTHSLYSSYISNIFVVSNIFIVFIECFKRIKCIRIHELQQRSSINIRTTYNIQCTHVHFLQCIRQWPQWSINTILAMYSLYIHRITYSFVIYRTLLVRYSIPSLWIGRVKGEERGNREKRRRIHGVTGGRDWDEEGHEDPPITAAFVFPSIPEPEETHVAETESQSRNGERQAQRERERVGRGNICAETIFAKIV